MGSVLSCCGLGGSDEDEYHNRENERTPLLQDPTAILQQPRQEPTPEDQQRDQEALQRILERTSDNLINIQSTFDRRKNGQTMDASEKTAYFKYLIDRMQTHKTIENGSEMINSEDQQRSSQSKKVQESSSDCSILESPNEISAEEQQLLNSTVSLFMEALQAEMAIKPVGDVLIKLSWD